MCNTQRNLSGYCIDDKQIVCVSARECSECFSFLVRNDCVRIVLDSEKKNVQNNGNDNNNNRHTNIALSTQTDR